jgi:hypothetical protein
MIDQNDRWWNYHAENPDVYETFERMAVDARTMGRTRIGAWLIFNVMRWNHLVGHGEEFALPNGFIALYARYFLWKHIEFRFCHGGQPFFELRPMRHDPFLDLLEQPVSQETPSRLFITSEEA